MNLTEAIHIVREEATRCRRLADDLSDDPLDLDGKCLGWAKRYREKADAMDTVVGALTSGTVLQE